MFRFAQEDILYGFLFIPILLLLFVLAVYKRNKAKKAFANVELHPLLMPAASSFRYSLKYFILIFALALIIFSLAGPRVGSKLKEVQKTGRELVFALDVSNSMLAEDFMPNRLEVAKQSLSSLMNRLENDKIALIVFAGDAYVQIPITSDFAAARLFLNSVSTDMVSKQGTAIATAIELASRSFTSAESDDPVDQESISSRAIIIITDGENHEEGAFEAAEKAAEKGIIVHTIGLGDPRGVPIPLFPGSRSFRKDKDGNEIVSRLDENTLMRLASVSGGYYIKASESGAGISQLISRLDELESEVYTAKIFAEYAERYQYFLGLGLLLLIIEFVTLDRKNRWLEKIKIFG